MTVEGATNKLSKLKLNEPRPRPKLHVKTTCPNCGTILEWVHSLPRHMKTKKCRTATKPVYMFVDKELKGKATN